MNQTVEYARKHWVLAVVIALATAWALDLVVEYYVRNWDRGFQTPGSWWLELDGEIAAAWVQAIGSIAAIGIAIFVAWYQHKLQQAAAERRREEAARISELLIVGLLKRLKSEAHSLSWFTAVDRLSEYTESQIKFISRIDLVDDLERLVPRADALHEVDAAEFLLIVQHGRTYASAVRRRLLERIAPLTLYSREKLWTEAWLAANALNVAVESMLLRLDPTGTAQDPPNPLKYEEERLDQAAASATS